MAVTFAITNLKRNVFGNKRVNTGTITATGTAVDNGDTAPAASVLGLKKIEVLDFSPFVDSTTNPEKAVLGAYLPVQGKVVFYGGGATAPDPLDALEIDVSNYVAEFTAIGF